VAGAGMQAQIEALDDRLVGGHAAALVEAGRGQPADGFGAVLEVIVNLFLFAQALDKVQVGFAVFGSGPSRAAGR